MKKILSMFLICIMFSLLATSCNSKTIYKDINVNQANSLIKQEKNIVIIDVRTEEEYNKGHIKNSILIPVDEIESRISEIQKYKDKDIILYCQAGTRSTKAFNILKKYKFNRLYNMKDGFSKWKYDIESKVSQ